MYVVQQKKSRSRHLTPLGHSHRRNTRKGHKPSKSLEETNCNQVGATQDVLSTMYKTYVRPVLDYGCEVVTLARTTNLKKYVVQSSAFRIITGGAKSTPITAMQLQTGIERFDGCRDKFTLKFWGSQKSRLQDVARFRLTTEHDFLGVYFHWLGVAANKACTLCGHARMDGDHLLQCTGLDEYLADDIVSRYWEARRQIVKKPSMGVG
ncbi:reverse transcriptase [Trichonephila clavipes]|uniref:Reverse transcriptase n=1 Tax=Trichonephila clavipes TaxID=2585209 RepID=A0A8X6VGS0_TRICX|nr:reverse transcriptase [Trichonephila clavipes]